MEKRKLDLVDQDPMKDYLDELMGKMEGEQSPIPQYEFHLEDEDAMEKEEDKKTIN